MDFSAIKDLYIGSTPVQSAWLNGGKVWGRNPAVDEQSIRDAMILWYDLKKQGATNENMTANPTLRDLSGNGHDATCYNFAWSGMSGVGGYNINLPILWNPIEYKCHVTQDSSYSNAVNIRQINSISFKFKISNYIGNGQTGLTIRALSVDGNSTILKTDTFASDGEYEFSYNSDAKFNLIFYNRNPVLAISDFSYDLELLPLYPNALVSDGVDDYCLVEGLPLLNKEDGYTVIAKRKWLTEDLTVESLKDKCFLSDLQGGGSPLLYGGACAVEINLSNGCNAQSCGSRTVVNISEDDIIYQTSQSYCGQSINISSTFVEGNGLFKLFSFGPGYYAPIALNSILLFNRDLTSEEIEWVKKNLIEGNDDDVDWYGVEFYTTSGNPDCIRIGNPELHKTLPVHTQMKGCLLADDGTVNKYLNETDWTGETLDGSQGQVMVEMPKQSYWKFETDGNIRRVKFSTKPLDGFKPTPQGYVSAYEASVQRSTNKLASVVNTTADYRGGNNNEGWDGTYRSLLGMPATSINRTNFRKYARNRKADSTEWNMMTYDMQKMLYWLFVVEYGTLNSQKAFNADKDANGYAQGGLGNGFTTLGWSKWNNFNGSCPVVPCGYTDELGNGTGQKEYSMPSEYDATIKKLYVPRYRGVENPFGHILQWTDGINVQIEPGDGLSKVFVCDDPSKFNDSNYDGYQHVGNEARTSSYVKSVIFGEKGEIIPDVVGGSSSTYFCDHHYTNIPTTKTLRGVLFGSNANGGPDAGFACATSAGVPANTDASVGSRLCFIPNNN